MPLIPWVVEFDSNLIPDPDFAPESEEKRQFYFKLAEIVKKKILWSSLILAGVTIFTFATLLLTSGSTIYHCFKMESSDYREVDINICKEANNRNTNVSRKFDSELFADPYFFLAIIFLQMTIFFMITTRRIVGTTIRLLAYGVEVTYYGAYGTFYFFVGMILGFLFLQTLSRNPSYLTGSGADKLYFWGYPNYPETFLGHTTRLLRDLGVLAGLIKIVLTSIKDPLDLFCSLSNMIQVSGNIPVHLPVITCRTLFSLVAKAQFTTENNNSEDYKIQQVLTALEDQGLLIEYDPNAKEVGITGMLTDYIGFRSYGYEKEIKAYISRGQLSCEDRNQLRDFLKLLILHVYTKKWSLIFIFSMAFTLFIFELRVGNILNYLSLSWNPTYLRVIFLTHLFTTIGTLVLVEYQLAWFLCVYSFVGSCIQALSLASLMIRYIGEGGNHYILSPYVIMAISGLQVFAIWKIWGIISLIQKGKKLLSQELSESPEYLENPENPELAAPLVTVGVLVI